MPAHQCYRCDLRFRQENELRDHLVEEHHVDPNAVEAHYTPLPPGVHPHRRAPRPSSDPRTQR